MESFKQLKMNYKKGIGWGQMALIMLALVVAILLIFNTNLLAQVLKRGSNVETCRLSVLAQARLKVAGSSPVRLDCERRNINFFKDKIEINGKKDSKYDFNALDKNTVNKAVAEELRLCWYMMGEGQINVFEQDISGGIENVCTICSEVSFDKEVDANIQFEGLLDYLKGTKIPNQDITYFDYLIRSQRSKYILGVIPWSYWTPWSWGTTDQISDNLQESLRKYQESKSYDDFNPSRRYVVYFLAWKPDVTNEALKTYTSSYYIGLATPSKITEKCSRLAN